MEYFFVENKYVLSIKAINTCTNLHFGIRLLLKTNHLLPK